MKAKDMLISRLEKEKLLPLYTTTNMDYLDKTEEVLLSNELSFIEVTYRSELASDTIKYLSDSGKLIVGAGTVRDLDTAKKAVSNGAQFIVTPGFSEEITRYCIESDILIIPGAVTPTEIMKATEYGIEIIKFFPADIYGGLKAIKSLRGPFFDIKFVPTGGVNEKNAQIFLENDAVLAVGGSFIISEKIIAEDHGETADKKLKEIVDLIR